MDGRLQSKGDSFEYGDWVTRRVRRLFTPVIPLARGVDVLIVVARAVPARRCGAGRAMSATVPVWFIAVYVAITALAPVGVSVVEFGGSVVACRPAVCAIVVDYLRFALDVPGVGWVNFLFVWLAVHQVGFWWAARERDGSPITQAMGWRIAAVSLGVLIAVTWVGWYPVAMVGVPGAEVTNMTPPTFAMFLLGMMQAGIIWAARDRSAGSPIAGSVARRRCRVRGDDDHLPVAPHRNDARGFGVPVRLRWEAFRIEPGTTEWWLTAPIWVRCVGASRLVLWLCSPDSSGGCGTRRPRRRTGYVVAACLLVAGARRRCRTSARRRLMRRSTGSSRSQRSSVRESWVPTRHAEEEARTVGCTDTS